MRTRETEDYGNSESTAKNKENKDLEDNLKLAENISTNLRWKWMEDLTKNMEPQLR